VGVFFFIFIFIFFFFVFFFFFFFLVLETNQLMLHKEITTDACLEIHTKHTNSLRGIMEKFLMLILRVRKLHTSRF